MVRAGSVILQLPAWLLWLGAPGVAAGQDAGTFRGDLAHSGVYAGEVAPQLTHVKWSVPTGGFVIGSPAVVNGVAYIGSADGRLYAIDAERGTVKWTLKTGARVASSPAVADGMVFVESYDDTLYAVDASSGRPKWKFATRGERRFAGTHLHGLLPAAQTMPDPVDVYLSSPAVWQGAVYFGSGDGNVYALDAKTGTVRWQFRTGDVVHASPAIVDGTVFIGSWDSWFYALDAVTGKLRWRFKSGEDTVIHNQVGFQSSAAVVDGVVYVGCRDAHLYVLDAHTGALRWSFGTNGSWVNTSPAVRDGRVYFATSDTRMLYAFDAATGKPVWSHTFSGSFFASPSIAGGLLYVANWDGRVTAVDLASGAPKQVFQTDASRQNLAQYSNPDGSMNFAAARLHDLYDGWVGALERIWTSMGSFLSSPVIVGGVLYIGSMDGHLYAIE
jgi:eukaryotic-like serine/threonine-protein kinase